MRTLIMAVAAAGILLTGPAIATPTLIPATQTESAQTQGRTASQDFSAHSHGRHYGWYRGHHWGWRHHHRHHY
jgi:hypothetical protein